jgi:hypothetical protein
VSQAVEIPGARNVGEEIPADAALIEVHVHELHLLFNAIDPSPLLEKDLGTNIEDFIVSWSRAASRDAQLALLIHVDLPGTLDPATTVPAAIHEHFRQRSLSTQRKLSHLFRVGRTSLAIGLLFLTVAVTLGGFLESKMRGSEIGVLLRESMVIGGWVAMWRPLEIFLYDWWPIRAERQLFERLATMPVQIALKHPS